jgi:hypothetical protein
VARFLVGFGGAKVEGAPGADRFPKGLVHDLGTR